ncbi:MAG: hypothetical protein ACE5H4_11280 [Candidatus Thorarchaeota archaeon]
MSVEERFVRFCGELGNFCERVTGTSLIDAYFGPDELVPSRQRKDSMPEALLRELDVIRDLISDQISERIRQDFMLSDIKSLRTTLLWLSGHEIPYVDLVEGLFHVEPRAFAESDVEAARQRVEDAFSTFPGEDTQDRVTRFRTVGEIIGPQAKEFIEVELQRESVEIGRMFKTKIYDVIGESVTDNGISYEAVRGKPWGAYNWYKGNYRSVNQFNIDRPINRNTVNAAVYHEYEHHVSLLWREKAYLERGWTDLSVVLLHTGRSIIAEGTADTAADFLGVGRGTREGTAVRAMTDLFRILSINAAMMMNQEEVPFDEAVEYAIERSFSPRESLEGALGFMTPKTPSGSPNFFSPYVFAYFIGRNEFVYPAFAKAKERNMLSKFYRTAYLNPYVGHSATWRDAFDWL